MHSSARFEPLGNQFGLALYDKSRENVDDGTPKFNPKAAAERIEDKLQRSEDNAAGPRAVAK